MVTTWQFIAESLRLSACQASQSILPGVRNDTCRALAEPRPRGVARAVVYHCAHSPRLEERRRSAAPTRSIFPVPKKDKAMKCAS
jgi:hypothetical protein